jgi:hypothetical protein
LLHIVAGARLVYADPALAREDFCVDKVDVEAFGGGYGGEEAFEEGREEGFGGVRAGEGAFVGYGERGAGGGRAAGWRREVLGVEGAHFFEQGDEGEQGAVFFGQDDGGVYWVVG